MRPSNVPRLSGDASWFAVMTGQGIEATSYNPLIEGMSDADNARLLDNVRAAIAQATTNLPPIPRAGS